MERNSGAPPPPPLQTTAAAALGGENDDFSSGDDIEYDEDGEGGGGMARRKRSNKEFKADAYAAFASMGLTANSTIPVASVLMRSPDVETNRDRCPRELWDLIQKHGGFAEKGLQGVTRQRILGQFRQWRTLTFSTQADAQLPTTTKESTLGVLEQLIPSTASLIAEAVILHGASSSIIANRGDATQAVRVWDSEGCFSLWDAQRSNLLTIVADAAHDHVKDHLYIDAQTNTGEWNEKLRSLLTLANADFAARCTWCHQKAAKKACDCIAMVAWEARDMFKMVVLRHVGRDAMGTTTITDTLISPPEHAVLPIGSVDAVYNICGALLSRMRKKANEATRGLTDQQKASCTAFFVVHHLSQKAATRAELPVAKVVRTQYGADTLTFASESLYEFISRLELVYWHNLHRSVAGVGVVEAMGELDSFARTDAGVVAAWNVCVRDVVDHIHPGHSVDDTDEGHARTALWMYGEGERVQFMFDLLATTYKNVRGKEYARSYAQEARRLAIARLPGTRDRLAANILVSSSSSNVGGGKKE